MQTEKLCSVDGCEKPCRAGGVCNTHYIRKRRYGTYTDPRRPLAERFWAKVEKTDTCWLWRGALQPNGYGRFGSTQRSQVGNWLAHRMAYTLAVGPIPEGLTIDHLCRNRACVNPAHLEPVTQGENNLRAYDGKCRAGHPFTTETTYVGPNGFRQCRTCRNARATESRARRRQRARMAPGPVTDPAESTDRRPGPGPF